MRFTILAWNLIRTGVLCTIMIGTVNASSSSATGATSILVSVSAICHLSNATMNFGEYDPISKNATVPLTGITSFTIACTKGASASISLSQGNNASHASAASRAMSAGGATPDYLNYDLYTNASYSSVWNTSNVIQYVANNSRTNVVRVYGKILPGQNVSAGYYMDTVSIVANF